MRRFTKSFAKLGNRFEHYRAQPIHYLTAWRLVGNSTVHTDEYLTQWKVSGNSQIQQYLTQWKVEGNSVVDNNAILSCGDLGQDGKYHVKISNGVDVFDIALTEPLRKVGDVADSIEFVDGVATLTRNFASDNMDTYTWTIQKFTSGDTDTYRFRSAGIRDKVKNPSSGSVLANALCAIYNTITANQAYTAQYNGIGIDNTGIIYLFDSNYNRADALGDFKAHIQGVELIYELATPTTETIQAPQIAVSSTNTYSSDNTTPYSAFTYANPLIYSCGDYSDVDGKYHVKISNGVTIYDIPLTEPLRKVGDVADSIEFANGVATVTRYLASDDMGDFTWNRSVNSNTGEYRAQTLSLRNRVKPFADDKVGNLLCSIYTTISAGDAYWTRTEGIGVESSVGYVYLHDDNYLQDEDFNVFKAHIQGVELIYELLTPTTEVIQVSPFPISSTDTYTSANDTPYSAFEYKKNVEIWSCGEYNATDNKYHILVQPQGGSIADIALDEPLRKVNDVADNIELINGVATLTRKIAATKISDGLWKVAGEQTSRLRGFYTDAIQSKALGNVLLCAGYNTITDGNFYWARPDLSIGSSESYPQRVYIKDLQYTTLEEFLQGQGNNIILYELATPTTELVDAPQIEKADSYSCVISQGGKAVSWSSFETDLE